MTDVRSLNRDVAKQRPESVFQTPSEIVTERLLTKGEKFATLERWRLSIFGELNASNEGMATRGYTRRQLKLLEAIEDAKAQLSQRKNRTVALIAIITCVRTEIPHFHRARGSVWRCTVCRRLRWR